MLAGDLVFGVSLGPCTFGFLAPVLAAAFAAGQVGILPGVGLIVAFAAGHCLFIVIAGASAGHLRTMLQRSGDPRRWEYGRHASGVLALVGALYLVYAA